MEGTTSEVFRIVTLSSGISRGSNLLAINDYFREKANNFSIEYAVFTSVKAPAIDKCRVSQIPYIVFSARNMELFEKSMLEIILDKQIHLIVLCGFLKRLSSSFIDSIEIPILNIHPALLPRFGGLGMYGMAVHEAVFASQETHSGATVHLVDDHYDHGRIIAKEEISISGCKSANEIADKVLTVEHMLYPRAIVSYLQATKSVC